MYVFVHICFAHRDEGREGERQKEKMTQNLHLLEKLIQKIKKILFEIDERFDKTSSTYIENPHHIIFL